MVALLNLPQDKQPPDQDNYTVRSCIVVTRHNGLVQVQTSEHLQVNINVICAFDLLPSLLYKLVVVPVEYHHDDRQ